MRSSLYCELSKEELTAIISTNLCAEISFAKLLTGGLFNTTYYIDTVQQGAVVLRVGPVNRHLLMPFEHDLMYAEQRVYELCKAVGAAVSEVLTVDTSKKLIDRDYMIVRYIPSIPMSEAVLTPEDNLRICRDIGEDTAKLHSIQNPCFGRIADAENGHGFSKWSDCLLYEYEQWESVSKNTPLFSASERAQFKETIKNAVPVLDEIQTPVLVHTDLWKGNILIRSDLKRPEFAAIIDADRAMWGDTELEFSSIQWTYNEPSFWAGYGRTLSEAAPSQIRREVYTLLWSLLNAYVYLREYNQPEQAYREKNRALESVKQLNSL